jgi:pSer/pThr/pTyr-binding forkhead associated (FHA) protein
MDDVLVEVVSKIEISMRQSRLADIQLFMAEGEKERAGRVLKGIEELSEGAYLFGTGPYTTGIYRLSADEIVIGRFCSVSETPGKTIVDIEVKDSICFGPREASRNHASIERVKGDVGYSYFLKDLGSTCGTYLNGHKILSVKDGGFENIDTQELKLQNGDIISIGSHHINCYVFFDKA